MYFLASSAEDRVHSSWTSAPPMKAAGFPGAVGGAPVRTTTLKVGSLLRSVHIRVSCSSSGLLAMFNLLGFEKVTTATLFPGVYSRVEHVTSGSLFECFDRVSRMCWWICSSRFFAADMMADVSKERTIGVPIQSAVFQTSNASHSTPDVEGSLFVCQPCLIGLSISQDMLLGSDVSRSDALMWATSSGDRCGEDIRYTTTTSSKTTGPPSQ